jgi:hypothetical protein
VRDTLRGEKVREEFGFLDRGRAQKDRLALGVDFPDFLDDLGILRLGRAVDDVIIILAPDRFVRGQINNGELVDVEEFVGR